MKLEEIFEMAQYITLPIANQKDKKAIVKFPQNSIF